MKTENLRILFVHSGADLYGASRSLLRLSSRLANEGVSVTVVLPYSGPLVDALKANGVTVVFDKTLPVIEREKVKKITGVFKLLINVFFSFVKLLILCRRTKPHLIHTMTAVILSPGLAAKVLGIPHVWHIRESFGEFGALWRYYQKYIIWLSTKIICVSTHVALQFESSGKLGKVIVIHNGFPVNEFPAVTLEQINKFKSTYGLTSAKYLIGVVGRIKFLRKGQEIFVRAAAILKEKFPDAYFLCIGSPFPGNEVHLENLLKLIHELNLEKNVIYTGDVENVKVAISALDVLVLSSVQPEPFGGVVVEAMALSRPVVATRIGGTIEQVDDEVTGYLVEPGSPQAMADALEKLLHDSEMRQRFAENGRMRFLAHFEFEAFYGKILALYEDVIEEGK